MASDLSTSSYRLLDSLGYKLTRASRAHERRLEALLLAVGLQRIEYTILCAIGREGRGTPSEIADMLGVEKSTISRALRTLKESGYVLEGTSAVDRRVRVLGLTPAGRTALGKGIEAAVAVNRRLLKALDDNERIVLADLLDRIRAIDNVRTDRI